MKEFENIEKISGNSIWNNIKKDFPEALILHDHELEGKNLNVCIVFCPLYAHSELSDSKLIFSPEGINESRVGGKFEAYFPILESINNELNNLGGMLNLTVVFANRGVILSEDPEEKHFQALEYHKYLYFDACKKMSEYLGINFKFYDYDSLEITFPKFYNPQNTQIPNSIKFNSELKPESQMISALNQYLGREIEDNKTNRKVVKSILQFKDTSFDAAFWLIAGYLAFDPLIPCLIGENGAYIVSERADSLFWISKLTPSLDKLTRVQLKVF